MFVMISIFIIRYHIKNLVLQHQAKTEEDYHCRYLHISSYIIILYIMYMVAKNLFEDLLDLKEIYLKLLLCFKSYHYNIGIKNFFQ